MNATNGRGKSSNDPLPPRPKQTTVADPAEAIAGFRARFRALGRAERAVAEKAYLKSGLRFHGVTQPDVRRTAVEFCRGRPELGAGGLRRLVDGLFASDYHDLRSLGIALLERKRALLSAADLPWLLDLVRVTANWAHVDWLATKVIGHLVTGLASARRRSTLRSWAGDGHMWVRRTALLAQLDELRAGRGDFDLFATIAAPLLGEPEFFIRKAIGWVLRDVSRRRPELTFRFLRRHGSALSGLTLREGARHLPAPMRARLSRRSRTAGARARTPASARARPAR